MKILDAQVDWKEGLLNDPRLEVLVDDIPSRDELSFVHEDGIYCGIKDGYVSYYAWSGNGNDGGYSGDCFDITMADGETVTLRGPWSSRAGRVNQQSFGPVVDCLLATDPRTLERGYTFRTGALTLSVAKQAVDLADEDVYLERQLKYSSNEPVWVPTRDGGDE